MNKGETMKTDFSISYTEDGKIIWAYGKEKGQGCGVNSTENYRTGKLKDVREALVLALAEVDDQLSLCPDHGN